MKLLSYLKSELAALKTGVKKFEYASWWLLRLGMVFVIIRGKINGFEPFVLLMLCVNLLATFSITLLRLISPNKSFCGNIPFRVQTYINIFIFFGSFLGHGFEFNGTVENYDKFMHIVSGIFVVFIGSELVKSMKGGKAAPAMLKTFAGTGFSFTVMVAWEIFEFISDFYLVDSTNQNYLWNPDPDMFFFKIFGYGKGETAQYPLFDTNIDLMCAVVGCTIGALALYFSLRRSEKKAELAQKEAVTV